MTRRISNLLPFLVIVLLSLSRLNGIRCEEELGEDDDGARLSSRTCSAEEGTCKDTHLVLPTAASNGETDTNRNDATEALMRGGNDEQLNQLVGDCQNQSEQCVIWASMGECETSPQFMDLKCPKSCGKCISENQKLAQEQYHAEAETQPSPTTDKTDKEVRDCDDDNDSCGPWAERGECEINVAYMRENCKRSCQQCPDQKEAIARGSEFGVPQVLTDRSNATESSLVMQLIQKSRDHIANVKTEAVMSQELLNMCRNQNQRCSLWALMGECDINPSYMFSYCAPACLVCEKLDLKVRCPPFDPDVTPGAWKPGDLNAMFERLSVEPYSSQYQVNVLSRDPWVLTMENVFDAEEAERLIQLSADQGFERSSGVGEAKPDGSFEKSISETRTSSNSWCFDDCSKDPIATRVIERLSNITQIPKNNSEALQMLKYDVGEFYKSHHDYMPKSKEKQQGVRILTMYLYLNDVEAGGGTKFNDLSITVVPKLGRAVLWPSVLNDLPHEKDPRTVHEALPVEAGVKYGTNAWFHQYDFQTPYKNGCAG